MGVKTSVMEEQEKPTTHWRGESSIWTLKIIFQVKINVFINT